MHMWGTIPSKSQDIVKQSSVNKLVVKPTRMLAKIEIAYPTFKDKTEPVRSWNGRQMIPYNKPTV